jgi:hypothetical protein
MKKTRASGGCVYGKNLHVLQRRSRYRPELNRHRF